MVCSASTIEILPDWAFFTRKCHSFLRYTPNLCHDLRTTLWWLAGISAIKCPFLSFQICQHNTARRIFHRSSGTCQWSGSGWAMKTCSGRRPVHEVPLPEASVNRRSPHCQQRIVPIRNKLNKWVWEVVLKAFFGFIYDFLLHTKQRLWQLWLAWQKKKKITLEKHTISPFLGSLAICATLPDLVWDKMKSCNPSVLKSKGFNPTEIKRSLFSNYSSWESP